MKIFAKIPLLILLSLFVLALIYLLTLFFPQPFFKNKISVGNISIYSDEELPLEEVTNILKSVQSKIERSTIYKSNTKHRVFIANNPTLWKYFSNINYKVGGLNYVIFNHNIFLRRVDIKENRLYGPSGNKVGGNRTLDYFIAHELTHTLEFESMIWYKYPINTNWILEGYAEYIAHGPETYEDALNQYLNVPETTSAKYYTRARTMITYILEKQNTKVEDLWSKVNDYDSILKKAIPNDNPNIQEEVYKW